MKRVRCPKCDHFITFDETQYEPGSSLVFECPECNKQFGIRIGVSKLFGKGQKAQHHDGGVNNEGVRREGVRSNTSDEDKQEEPINVGKIVVIENVFHYKQIIPLQMGENVIGRYQKGNNINCPIETVDPSVDMTHCHITVSRDKNGSLKYILRDGPSNTGTFVDNEILGDRERRVIESGSLFTIGATSIILKGPEEED